AEIVVHAYPDGSAPGLDRVRSLELDSVLCPATGTSEDVALLLADELGARLIVAVGMRTTLVEFLDKDRPGMASAFLTRMRVGDKIVEPKGVSRLYQSRISTAWLVLLVVAAAVTILVSLRYLTVGKIITRDIGLELSPFWHWLTGLFHGLFH
ncbi:MAG TPA: putative cytokinetic ring protein SteA, partial [Streptosporangiaceae bacterium]|nr:putative cytokinetic ring protein SteA [Streptosporangiaceae bacterium]